MDIRQLGRVIDVHRKKSELSQKGLSELAGLRKTVVFDCGGERFSRKYDDQGSFVNLCPITLNV